MTSLRRAVAADALAAHTVTEAAYLPWVPRLGLRPAPMDADYSAAIAAGLVWLAEDADGIAGVLVLEVAPDHVLIENVAVAERVRRSGIGMLLLEQADAVAGEQGLGEVRLYTHELMTENIRYYTRRGFAETHRAREHGFARVYFAKPV